MSRAGLIGLWAAQVALAGLFLLAGSSKLAGSSETVALFEAIGAGQWLRRGRLLAAVPGPR